MADLYYSSPDDYTFIREVWKVVAQFTAYKSEIQDTPRFPVETLLSGGGDCEDHAILFASMILASPAPWVVEFTYMDGYHPTQPQTLNHVIVQVMTQNREYLVEAHRSRFPEIPPMCGGINSCTNAFYSKKVGHFCSWSSTKRSELSAPSQYWRLQIPAPPASHSP